MWFVAPAAYAVLARTPDFRDTRRSLSDPNHLRHSARLCQNKPTIWMRVTSRFSSARDLAVGGPFPGWKIAVYLSEELFP